MQPEVNNWLICEYQITEPTYKYLSNIIDIKSHRIDNVCLPHIVQIVTTSSPLPFVMEADDHHSVAGALSWDDSTSTPPTKARPSKETRSDENEDMIDRKSVV